jgi:hypothetical protein
MCLLCKCLGALWLSLKFSRGYSPEQGKYFTYWAKKYYFLSIKDVLDE